MDERSDGSGVRGESQVAPVDLSPAEIAAAIATAERIADEYRGYVARLAAVREGATGVTDLRARATAELARCASGLRRIDDTAAQLRALARRAAQPPGRDPSAR